MQNVRVGIGSSFGDAAAPRTEAERKAFREGRDGFQVERMGADGKLPPAALAVREAIRKVVSRSGTQAPPAPPGKARIRFFASPDRFDRSFVCRVVPRIEGPDVAFPGIEVKKLVPKQGGGDPTEEAVAEDRYVVTPRANDLLVQFREDGCYRIAPKAGAGLDVDARRDGCVVVVNSQGPLFFLELPTFSTRTGLFVDPSPFPFLALGDAVSPKGVIRDPNGVRHALLTYDPSVKPVLSAAAGGRGVEGATPPRQPGGQMVVERGKLVEVDIVKHASSKTEGDALKFDLGIMPLGPGFHIIEARASDSSAPPLMTPDVSGHAQPAPGAPEQKLASESGKSKGELLGADEMTSKLFRACVVSEYADPQVPVQDAMVWNLGNDLLRLPGDMFGMLIDRIGVDGLFRAILTVAGIDPKKGYEGPHGLRVKVGIDRARTAEEAAWGERVQGLRDLAGSKSGGGLALVVQSLFKRVAETAQAGGAGAPFAVRERALACALSAKLGDPAAFDPAQAGALIDREATVVARRHPLRETRDEDMIFRARSVSAESSGVFKKAGFLLTFAPQPIYLDVDVDASGLAAPILEEARLGAIRAVALGIRDLTRTVAASPGAQAFVASQATPGTSLTDSLKAAVTAPDDRGAAIAQWKAHITGLEAEATRRAETSRIAAEAVVTAERNIVEAREQGKTAAETRPLRGLAAVRRAERDVAAVQESAHQAVLLQARAALAALEGAQERGYFVQYIEAAGRGIEVVAAGIVDAYLKPALLAAEVLLRPVLRFHRRVNLLPFRESVDILLAPEDLASIEVQVAVGARHAVDDPAGSIEAVLVNAAVNGLVKLVSEFFEGIADRVTGAADSAAEAFYLASATVDTTAADMAHEAYALYYRMFEAKDRAEYDDWKKGLDARKEEYKRELRDRAMQRADGWRASAREAVAGAAMWRNAAVRALLSAFLEHLGRELLPPGYLSGKINDAVHGALQSLDIDVRLGNPLRLRLKVPKDVAFLASLDGLDVLRKPFDGLAKDKIAASNPSLLFHVDPERGGEAVMRYDLAALAAMLGAKTGDVKERLAAGTAAFVGGLELLVKGRPRFAFRDDGATFSIDAAVDARRAGLESPCTACDAKGTVTRSWNGRDETLKCHVCGGAGRTRRGRGPLAVRDAVAPSGGTGMGVHSGFLHQVAYALWSAGLFDLKISKGPHPLKEAILLAAREALAPNVAPRPPLPPPAGLVLLVPNDIAIGADFEVSVRRPSDGKALHESVSFEVAGAEEVAASGEVKAVSNADRGTFHARFRVNRLPEGRERPVVTITAKAKRVAAGGAAPVVDSATATVPVVSRRSAPAGEPRGVILRANNPAAARFGLEVAKDVVDVPGILADFGCSMQSTMPPMLHLTPPDAAALDGAAGAREAQGVRLSWGDIVLEMDMAWKGVPIKGRVQVAFDTRFRAWQESADEARARGVVPKKGLRFRMETFDIHVDLLTPLLGVDPDYVVLMVEWLFEILAERLVCWTIEASFGQEIFEGFVLDDIFRKLCAEKRGPEVEAAPEPPPPPPPGAPPPPEPIQKRIRAAIGQDVLAAIGARVRDVKINPASAKGYVSAGVTVEAFTR